MPNLHLLQLPRLVAQRRSSAIFGLVIIVMMWAGAYVKYLQDRENDFKDAVRSGAGFAMVFEENVLRSIDELDNMLSYMRRNVEEWKDVKDYSTILHATKIPDDIIVQVSIIDAHGILRASSAGPQPAPPLDLSDREHFRAQLAATSDRLFVSKPLIGRVSQKWSVQLSRRFSNSDGTFGGVVVASLDPEHFTEFYNKLALGNSAGISLIRDDGVVLSAGGSRDNFAMGEHVGDTDLFAHMQAGANATFTSYQAASGKMRLVALRKVRNQPLWVAVALDQDAVLAGSLGNFRLDCIAVLLLSLAILGAMERILRTETAARQKADQLEMTLESMSQGIMLVTKDRTIPIINKKCAELLKLPAEFVEHPPTFDQLVAYHHAQFPGAAAATGLHEFAPAGDAGKPNHTVTEWTQPDGTVLEVRGGRLPDGGFVQTFTDITKRVQAEAYVARLASEDSLTGLLNRRGFRSALVEAESQRGAACAGGERIDYAVLFIDLDRFKIINDTLGHRVGDLLLQATAQRLRSALRGSDVLARLGGDEFAVIVRDVASRAALEDLANCLIKCIRDPFDLAGYRVRTTISVGIAVSPADGATADDLSVAADLALYGAKERSRDGWQFYQPSMTTQMADRSQIETDLREAIENNELELYYQPIVSLRDSSITGFEALARWRHGTRGFVPPSDFIPVAEDTGMITGLGEWALTKACTEIAALPYELKIAVNLSPVQCAAPDLVAVVQRALIVSGLPAHRLELEITEGVLLGSNEHILSVLRQLRQIGVRIALDDFGTGYSALGYLRQFPLDRIKIDRSFVTDIVTRSDQVVIVQAVVSIARSLGMAVTAEGVENADQRDFLKALGCDNAQGFLFGKPAALADLPGMLAARPPQKIMAA